MSKSTENTVIILSSAGRLRQIRAAYGLSQGAAAQRLGVKQQNWGRYETGTRVPDTFLGGVITHFPVDPRWLLTGEVNDRLCAMTETVIRDHDRSMDEVAERLRVPVGLIDSVIRRSISPSEGFVADLYKSYGASPPSLAAGLGTRFVRKPGRYDRLERMIDQDPEALPGLIEILEARASQRKAMEQLLKHPSSKGERDERSSK